MILQPNKFSVLGNIGILLVGQTEQKQSEKQRNAGNFLKQPTREAATRIDQTAIQNRP